MHRRGLLKETGFVNDFGIKVAHLRIHLKLCGGLEIGLLCVCEAVQSSLLEGTSHL